MKVCSVSALHKLNYKKYNIIKERKSQGVKNITSIIYVLLMGAFT